MKKILYIPITAILMISIAAFAITPNQNAKNPFTEGLLWSITKDGEIVGHVFGTIHSDDKRVIDLSLQALEILANSRNFAMEVIPAYGPSFVNDIYQPAAHTSEDISYEMLPISNTQLSEHIGDTSYEEVESALLKLGIKKDVVQYLKPWVAIYALASSPRWNKRNPIMDHLLFENAANAQQDIYEVEGLKNLYAAHYDFPIEAQIALLRDRLRNKRTYKDIESMHLAYLGENLGEMLTLSTKFISEESLYRQLDRVYLKHALYIRNVVMAFKMLPLLREKGAFVAVGALHLHGKEGVLGQLEAYGYKAKRVALLKK
ncbi:MAG: TraB/GumN family protein [Pseudomonadota bacterium]